MCTSNERVERERKEASMTGHIQIVIRTTSKDCRLLIHFYEIAEISHMTRICLPQAQILKQEVLACDVSVQDLCRSLHLLEPLYLVGSNSPECSFYTGATFVFTFCIFCIVFLLAPGISSKSHILSF